MAYTEPELSPAWDTSAVWTLSGLGFDDWLVRLPWWFVLALPEWAWEEV
jgi:hypothetical protein